MDWWTIPSDKILQEEFKEDLKFKSPMFKKVGDTWVGRIYGTRKFSAGGHTWGWEQQYPDAKTGKKKVYKH